MSISINGEAFPVNTLMTRIIPSTLVETSEVTSYGECLSTSYELGGEINVKIMGWSLSFPALDDLIESLEYFNPATLVTDDFGTEIMFVSDYDCVEHPDGTVTFTFNGRIGAPNLVILESYLVESN